ncbi:putative transcription factor C2H2 family [Rosa chinensis]|uniref:RING-type E3 ubiquitin transferase n=1 Tax=Rosa chinensis TaxID=74649 RepID=A0A2P6P2U3_ROSCH|nr:putative transcription factor C2H2 family [Rosa chinensis]
MQFIEVTRVLGDMGVPRQVQQTIVAKISEFLVLGNMDRTANNGYIDVTIIHNASYIDLNIVPSDEEDDSYSFDQMYMDDYFDHDRVARQRGFDLIVEPDNDDSEIECGDPLDAMLARLYYDINHVDAAVISIHELLQRNLPTFTETNDDHHIKDFQLMNYRDIEAADQYHNRPPHEYPYNSSADHDTEDEDHFVLDELLMETYDNGNEEVDGATLESIETYMAMTIPASKSAIEDLKKLRLESVETARHAGLCSICLEDFKAGVETTCLPCLHFFHGDCVVRWLGINHQCPLCRFPMPHDGTSIY